MNSKMILFTTWLTSNPSRTRALTVGALLLLSLMTGVAANAGSASGGSHGGW